MQSEDLSVAIVSDLAIAGNGSMGNMEQIHDMTGLTVTYTKALNSHKIENLAIIFLSFLLDVVMS